MTANNPNSKIYLFSAADKRLTASITRAASTKDSFAGKTRWNYPNLREGEAAAASGAGSVSPPTLERMELLSLRNAQVFSVAAM